MIKECKKCGSKNLYLEPRIKGQDVLTADMVALKCKDCGSWLKWCPKNERVNYLKIQDEKPDKWQKLKEWVDRVLQAYLNDYDEKIVGLLNDIIDKMQELEAEDVKD